VVVKFSITTEITHDVMTTLWETKVSFDPRSSRLTQSSGRWWWTTPSSLGGELFILMSHDAKRWSWRRDRITDYHAVAIVQGTAVVVGDEGTILLSTNRAKTWKPLQTQVKKTLRDVCLTSDGKFGLAVGDSGTILRSQGNNLERWTKLGYDLATDLTSCAIVERSDGTDVFIAGKGGAIYVANDRSLSTFNLISSPSQEDIFSMASLETGVVLAVGGNYQDPELICEEGFIVIDSELPDTMVWKLVLSFILLGFWGFTIRKVFLVIKAYREPDPEEDGYG
jgi:photosystem II stability/assembly factor-like uncharacterized protein